MSAPNQPQTRPRAHNVLKRVALVVPLIIVLGCILGPVIYSVSLTAKRAHQTNPPSSTSQPPTFTYPTVPATTTEPGLPSLCKNDSTLRLIIDYNGARFVQD
jgi:hypothetical protein